MPTYIKTSTGSKIVYNVWQKQSGVWKLIPTIWTKDSDVWKLVHEDRPVFVFNTTISSNTTNYNMRDRAVSAGWDTLVPLIATVTINSGVTVVASSIASYAFSSGSTFPVGSTFTLINYGVILGKGGTGGTGGTRTASATTLPTNGSQGGPSLFVAIATSLYNYGRIAAGGGGGGGGRPAYFYNATSNSHNYYGGGGGGGGIGSGGSGTAGAATVSMFYKTDAQAGGGGTLSSAGAGGAGGSYNFAALNSAGTIRADFGGVGGGFGAIGAEGNGAFSDGVGTFIVYSPAGVGGASGNAVTGNSLITYNVVGTINGAQF